jgi:hypothetical protein
MLMTDVIMPEMNSRDLAKNLLHRYPHLRHLFTSGYTASVIATTAHWIRPRRQGAAFLPR